jgi:aquaporin Z
MNKYIVELIGTFFLVTTIGMTVLEPHSADHMAPLAIGSALMVMIFAGGHISGGHYNPAVTLAVFLRGKCPAGDVAPYWVAQVLGAVLAAFIVIWMKGKGAAEAISMDIPKMLVAEALFTFALCYVVLNVATAKGTNGNSFYGLAIGFTVLTGAYSVGAVSGGAFNPAVVAGLIVMGKLTIGHLWIYLVANLGAAVVAAIVFKTVNPGDK